MRVWLSCWVFCTRPNSQALCQGSKSCQAPCPWARFVTHRLASDLPHEIKHAPPAQAFSYPTANACVALAHG